MNLINPSLKRIIHSSKERLPKCSISMVEAFADQVQVIVVTPLFLIQTMWGGFLQPCTMTENLFNGCKGGDSSVARLLASEVLFIVPDVAVLIVPDNFLNSWSLVSFIGSDSGDFPRFLSCSSQSILKYFVDIKSMRGLALPWRS